LKLVFFSRSKVFQSENNFQPIDQSVEILGSTEKEDLPPTDQSIKKQPGELIESL
jgi:hypothetical protein